VDRDEVGVPPLAFAQLLASEALDPAAVARFDGIMAREGLDARALVERDVQAPLRWFREVYPELDSDEATRLGLACADQAQLTSFGPLSLPLVSAGSVSEIVELLTFLPLITTALSPQMHPSERGLTVVLNGLSGDPDLDRLAVTYCGSALVRLLELLVGDMSTVTLHLSWRMPSSMGDHEDVRAGRLTFDAPISFLRVPAATLTEVCRFSDPIAYRHAISDLEDDLEHRRGARTFSRAVRSLIDEGAVLRSGQSVAAELSMSVSTLKRRLAGEGMTFRDIREASLKERATLLLLERSVSVSEIATDLGYGDVANFSHAFKRWTGQSPSEFRRDEEDR